TLDLSSRLFVRSCPGPIAPPSFRPTSYYVEYCWLPVLGPSATWLYRHLGQMVAAHPDGVLVDLEELALDHGLGHSTGRHGALARRRAALPVVPPGDSQAHQHRGGSAHARHRGQPMKTMAIRLQDDVHAQLSVVAQLDGTTVAEEIRQAIEGHLARKRAEGGL